MRKGGYRMPDGFKLKRNHFLLIILAIFFIFMMWLLIMSRPDMIQFSAPVPFNNGWTVEADQTSHTVVLSREVTSNMPGKVVCFYVYDAFVDADVDGVPIYSFGHSFRFLRSPGTLWHMIELPSDSLGSTLSIRVSFAYDYKYTTDFDITLGTSGSTVISLLGEEALDLAVNFVILALGILLCFVYLLQLKNGMAKPRSLFLGLLSLCFVFWTNNNLFFTQIAFP